MDVTLNKFKCYNLTMIERLWRRIVIVYFAHYYGFCEDDDGMPFDHKAKCAGCKSRIIRDFLNELD